MRFQLNEPKFRKKKEHKNWLHIFVLSKLVIKEQVESWNLVRWNLSQNVTSRGDSN